MVDVFISYSRSDRAMVAMLARAVEAEGYEVWWDAELPPHQSYGEVITGKIEGARAAIVVWSATAVKSEWVRAEADMARHLRKLVQTTIDDATPPLPFNQIQYAEIGDWRGEADHPGWRKVKRSLAELCGPATEDASQRPVAPPPAPRSAAAASGGPRRWPLLAGIAVGAAGLAAAGGMWLDQRGGATASPPAVPSAAPAPSASPVAAAAETVARVAGDEVPIEPDRRDFTFPDSSTQPITPAELENLGPATLRYARNEIYARKGRRFADPDLRQYFERFAWYRPQYDEVTLNPIERRNVALIQQSEQRYR